MKKIFFPIVALAMSLNASADDTSKTITLPDGTTLSVSPAVTMKVVVDGETERTFNFGSYKESTYYAVDFGDGELVVTNEIGKTTSTATATAVAGVAKGEGDITVYADDAEDIWYFSTATGTNKTSSITSIDLSKLKKVQQMNLGGNAYETIDLSACDSLRTFTSANGALKTIDFSNNLELTSANLVNNQLTSVNVSKNTKLDGLTVYQNKLTELDLTNNAIMTGIYAYENNLSSVKFAEDATFKTVNLQKNALKEIALPAITGSSSMLYLNDNELTELTVPTSVATFEVHNNKLAKISLVDCTKSCKLDNNCFTISTMPAKPAGLNTTTKIKKFTYTQQAPMAVRAKVVNSIDLSSELTAVGELQEGTATTVYAFVDGEGNALAEGTDYEISNGVATFKKSFTGIHAVMTTAAFPKATDANAFTTTAFDVVVDETAKTITLPDGTTLNVLPAAVMKVVVDGETERTFNFGSYQDETYYAVDFGDGELVVTNKIGKTTSTATATAVSGVAKGEGDITVYADDAEDIWYFSTATGTNKTSSITSIDLSKLKKVQQMNLGGNAYETIDLSACDSLRTFTSANGALTTIDFSNNLELTTANLVNNQLTSVNVSKNTKLDGLTVYQNKLTELDLTNNAVMTGLYAYENNLSSVKFAEGATFKTVNLQKNALKEITLPAISGSSSMLYLNDNELTELTVPTSVATFEAKNNKLAKISLVDCTKTCNLDNNCFTISTMPAKPAGLNTATKIKKFTYTQQAPMSVDAKVTNTLDLSSELTAVGELTEPATTVYAFVDTEGNTLTVGTDYEMAEGVVTFKKSFTGIHAVMTTEAFPKATDANAFTTTAFDVDSTTAIKLVDINTQNNAFYTIGGVKNVAPVKGVNIRNGKKFVVK